MQLKTAIGAKTKDAKPEMEDGEAFMEMALREMNLAAQVSFHLARGYDGPDPVVARNCFLTIR